MFQEKTVTVLPNRTGSQQLAQPKEPHPAQDGFDFFSGLGRPTMGDLAIFSPPQRPQGMNPGCPGRTSPIYTLPQSWQRNS